MTSSQKQSSEKSHTEAIVQDPLTPELVEDEAVRGDFVIRWAVVLLAFLLACTEISTSTTLVHIRSGDYLASHGILPPQNDVFSYTATNHLWVNLSWMYDLLSSGLFSLGGAAGLVLFKAVIICITYWLFTSISVRNVSNWWTSICATLALYACFPQFTATPETITFLGIALLLWLLYRWRWSENNRYLWSVVLLILIWGQFDSRMFLGLTILLMYGIGELVGVWVNRPGFEMSSQRISYWQVIAICFVIAMIHPFGWRTLTEPWEMLTVQFPALRTRFQTLNPQHDLGLGYLPVASSDFFLMVSRSNIASLLLVGTALMMFFLNRKNADIGEMFVYLAMVGYALIASHFLAMTAVVSMVFAAVNAQQWYRNTFRQTYSVETSEILFSRGGRAITVLALSGFAFLGITSRLHGGKGDRIGLDFHPVLNAHCIGMKSDLESTFDDRPFHFTMKQGDILIWIGKRPFVDSRVGIYTRSGSDHLLKLHNLIRYALVRQNKQEPQSGLSTKEKSKIWKTTLNRYQVSYVIPRLFGMPPDYRSYFELWNSAEWQKQKLGSTTAIFYRSDLIIKDSPLTKFLLQHRSSMVQQTFRKDLSEKMKFDRHCWIELPTWQAKYLWLPRDDRSPELFEAYHCIEHLKRARQGEIKIAVTAFVAMAYWAIRNSNAVLLEDPQNEEAFRLLGEAYLYLGLYESHHSPETGGMLNSYRRYYQAISAINQAIAINPNNPKTRLMLFDLYQSHHQPELALQELTAFDRLTATSKNQSPHAKVLNKSLSAARHKLTTQAVLIDQKVQSGLENEISKVTIAHQLAQGGYTLKAYSLLKEDAELYAHDFSAQLFKTRLLFEMGQVEQAYKLMQSLIKTAEARDVRDWQSLAALLCMVHGEYDQAISYWEDAADQYEREQTLGVFQTFPLTVMSLPTMQTNQRPWPLNQTSIIDLTLGKYPSEIALAQLNATLCEMEAGQNKAAEKRLRQTLKDYPNLPHRRLLVFYLHLLSNNHVEATPPSNWIPNDGTMFYTPEKKSIDHAK